MFDEELDVFLKNEIVEVPEGEYYWHYIKSQNDTVRTIEFNDDSQDSYFIIKKEFFLSFLWFFQQKKSRPNYIATIYAKSSITLANHSLGLFFHLYN